MDCHCHQGDAYLLAGREEHIHLAAGGVVGDLLGEVDKDISLMSHRAYDHDDLIAVLLRANRPPRSSANFFRISDTGAAEFLNDYSHRILFALQIKFHHGGTEDTENEDS